MWNVQARLIQPSCNGPIPRRGDPCEGAVVQVQQHGVADAVGGRGAVVGQVLGRAIGGFADGQVPSGRQRALRSGRRQGPSTARCELPRATGTVGAACGAVRVCRVRGREDQEHDAQLDGRGSGVRECTGGGRLRHVGGNGLPGGV